MPCQMRDGRLPSQHFRWARKNLAANGVLLSKDNKTVSLTEQLARTALG